MDPISTIVLALAAGAAAAAKDIASQAVKDGYAGLKALIVRKYGSKGDVQNAVDQTEKKPDSVARQAVLKEELQAADAEKDADLLKQAQALIELLKQHDATSATYSAVNTGSGMIVQGEIAVGQGVVVRGDVQGGISTGNKIP